MDGNAILFIVIGLAVVGVVISIAVYFDRKRTRAISEKAEEMGLQFEKTANHLTADITSRFELFQRGRGAKSANLVYGATNGTGVWMFDFQYSTGSGKNRRVHNQTVCCFSSTELQLPRFNLYRESLLSRIGSGVFGMQDIDFETHPDFSKTYVLKGDSEVEIRECFHEQILSFFETQDKNLCVEGDGERLLVYRRSKRVKPELLKDFLSEGFGIFREFRSSQ